MADCRRSGKPSGYKIKVNSAFRPYGYIGEPSTDLSTWVKAERVHLYRVASNTVWSHMAADAP